MPWAPRGCPRLYYAVLRALRQSGPLLHTQMCAQSGYPVCAVIVDVCVLRQALPGGCN
jgi:hypothetical protein